MRSLDILIPVKNEEKNIPQLLQRISWAMFYGNIKYKIIFIDDHSTDNTVDVLRNLQATCPIKIYTKLGRPGKAYSIIEAAYYSDAEYVVMLDADLQYPPEIIPEMFDKVPYAEVVVAKRAASEESLKRKVLSTAFSTLFGKVLHGLNVDVQSGLKLFKRDLIFHLDTKSITPWTLDLSLLIAAKELGYKIAEVDINFVKRISGESKVNLLKTIFEIGSNALKLKINRKRIYSIWPKIENSMVGAGIIHKQKDYITHTTLPEIQSAFQTLKTPQTFFILALIILLEIGIILSPFLTAISIMAILSLVYFLDVLFGLMVILKSLHFPPEIVIEKDDLGNLESNSLPTYTILCPLYKEANMLPRFLKSIENLDWPKEKLDVIILLEEDDYESINIVKNLSLENYIRVLIVPDSLPKTKPKACNFGLSHARGEYLVIYDAEDRPETDQLKKAYLAFQKIDPRIICLQAKLNYFNPHQNLLTRFFTAEYSLWFDVILTGLQSIETTIPLGGTSNHFKTANLKGLQGWDPFNVTEDCDLGIRLYKAGFKTAIIDSTTYEEANSNLKNWIRQRSRWIKGYMQTYLVHMRNPIHFIKNHGIHAFIFQLVIGARISFMLINPFLWLMTISYFAFYEQVGLKIESIFPSIVFYMAAFSLIFGNFMYIYNYMIGLAKRENWSIIKYVYLVPIYWLFASIASFIALFQLIWKPHYWEKTIHGLDTNEEKSESKIFKSIFRPIKFVTNSIF